MLKYFKKLTSRKGLTLTELIVASILVGIVMVGIAGFSLSLVGIENTTNRTTLLVMQTSAAMSHITASASQAIGWIGNQGIAPAGANGVYRSFRLDKDVNQNDNNTPGNYADDHWYIYTTIFGANGLFFCRQNAGEGPNPATGGGTCTAGDAIQLLANLESWEHQLVPTQAYVEIKLTTRFNPAQAAEPIDNPEHTFETRISPHAHSW